MTATRVGCGAAAGVVVAVASVDGVGAPTVADGEGATGAGPQAAQAISGAAIATNLKRLKPLDILSTVAVPSGHGPPIYCAALRFLNTAR